MPQSLSWYFLRKLGVKLAYKTRHTRNQKSTAVLCCNQSVQTKILHSVSGAVIAKPVCESRLMNSPSHVLYGKSFQASTDER